MAKGKKCWSCGGDPEYSDRCAACNGTGKFVPRKKKIKEANVENPCVEYAKRRGAKVRKLNGLGFRDWPDRVFFYRNNTLFIEFKKPGKVPTESQAKMHTELREQSFMVLVIDDKEFGVKALKSWMDVIDSGGRP